MPDRSIMPQTAASDTRRRATVDDVYQTLAQMSLAIRAGNGCGLHVAPQLHCLTPDVLNTVAAREMVKVTAFPGSSTNGPSFLSCAIGGISLYAYLDEEA